MNKMKKFILKFLGYLIITSAFPIFYIMIYWCIYGWLTTLTAVILVIMGAVVIVSADVQKSPIKIINTMNIQEELARQMYDKYCESVGGVAFNGDKLPTSDEFFNDETKSKQANAWRDVSFMAIRKLIHN